MARIFITGSADGLGRLAAGSLIQLGHSVVLHARNLGRGQDAMDHTPGASAVLTGDLSSIAETKALAHAANSFGKFDAVIHNAGVYRAPASELFHVNVLAPFILTSLIQKPKRLIYLSSGMHTSGRPNLEDLTSHIGRITYSDTKLHMVMLCMAVAGKWKDVYANTVNPGWVPTRMGGSGAPDSLEKGYETQVWLAISDDPRALVTGKYFHHKRERPYNPLASDHGLQDRLLEACAELTGIPFPD